MLSHGPFVTDHKLDMPLSLFVDTPMQMAKAVN